MYRTLEAKVAFFGVCVGPQIGMNPIPILGLPDLEYRQIPTHNDSGIPVPIWGPHFECRSKIGDETLKSQIGTNPKLLLVSD
jgi:hypothetical protein